MFATVDGGSHRQLDASVGASEPHDFADRLTCRSSKAPSASTASRPAFVTCARPSVGQDGGVIILIWGKREEEYFCAKGWTGEVPICPSGCISALASNPGVQSE